MKKFSFFKIIFTLVFFSLSFLPFVASASVTDNISGFAWSSNIGWISFNCTNNGSCGTSNYGVNKDVSGNLVGYAWSPNIGWIRFGGLSGFPTGGSAQQNAQVVGTNLIGWAQALSADGNGWTGWISLSGTGPGYGVTLTNTGSTLASQYNCMTDCVWGSDVLGWIDFSGVIEGPAVNTVPTVTSPTATSITTTSAILGANVVSLGIPASISARGTCYGTSPNPMTNCLAQGGTTTGVYSHSRTSLTPNTTYYYRGYAINATGTGYSADGTFTATNTNDSCGTYSGATPRLTEPTTNPSACNPGIYANSPADITINGSQAWRWSCGTVTSCTAPKYGCTTATDTNYDPTGPNNTYGCANTCANGQTNYPTCTTGGFTVGQCSADHYNCVAGTSINSSNNPSRWTWTCLGSDNITNTDDVSCAEPHPPGYEEPQ